MSPAPTPRTEAAIKHIFTPPDGDGNLHTKAIVEPDVARQLERELADANAENVTLRAIFPKILEALGSGAFCTTEATTWLLSSIPEEIRLFLQKRDAQAERLAGALKLVHEYGQSSAGSDGPRVSWVEIYEAVTRELAAYNAGKEER